MSEFSRYGVIPENWQIWHPPMTIQDLPLGPVQPWQSTGAIRKPTGPAPAPVKVTAPTQPDKSAPGPSDCASNAFCIPTLAGIAESIKRAIPRYKAQDVKRENCVCWSDIAFYGGGAFLAALGILMLVGPQAQNLLRKG